MLVISLKQLAQIPDKVRKLTGDVLVPYSASDQVPASLHIALASEKAKFEYMLVPDGLPAEFTAGMAAGMLMGRGTSVTMVTDSAALLASEPLVEGKAKLSFTSIDNLKCAGSAEKEPVKRTKKPRAAKQKDVKTTEDPAPVEKETDDSGVMPVPEPHPAPVPEVQKKTSGPKQKKEDNERAFEATFREVCGKHGDEWPKAYYAFEITDAPKDLEANLSMLIGDQEAVKEICGAVSGKFDELRQLVSAQH